MGQCFRKNNQVLGGRDSGIEQHLLSQAQRAAEAHTRTVDPSVFEEPARPIGVSGGTAAFYSMVYKKESLPPGKSPTYFIGKDLAHAADELSFYERAAKLQRQSGWSILNWTFEYGGVCQMDCTVGGKVEKRKQILLRNLFDDAKGLRLLDIKIGAVTAVAGWQGKGRTAALRNRAVDSATNSQVEGYRAEGFDGAPRTLESLLSATTRDLLHGVGQHVAKLEVGGRRARRLALQRVPAAEFLGFFVNAPPEEPHPDRLNPLEITAAAMRGCVRSLIGLVAAAARVRFPQQWIGSSVALAFDAAADLQRRPYDPLADETAEKLARIHIFDWGRSELTSMEIWDTLSKAQCKERAHHWTAWVSGILRLTFEVARSYRRTFCPIGKRWRKVRVRVWSVSQDLGITDVTKGTDIGEAMFDLEAREEEDILLQPPSRSFVSGVVDVVRHAHIKTMGAATKTGRAVFGAVAHGKLTSTRPTVRVSVSGPHKFPPGSALKEQWTVRVESASNLPKTETIEWCNPVATVQLIDDAQAIAQFHTGVVLNSQKPKWGESFAFGVADEAARKTKALVPPELVRFAPGGDETDGDIMQWDLAAEDGARPERVQDALRAFKDCFFRDDAPSGERRTSVQDIGEDVLAAQQDTLAEERARRLEVAEHQLREQEKALRDSMTAKLDAETRSAQLQAEVDWLRANWQGPSPPPPRAGSPLSPGSPASVMTRELTDVDSPTARAAPAMNGVGTRRVSFDSMSTRQNRQSRQIEPEVSDLQRQSTPPLMPPAPGRQASLDPVSFDRCGAAADAGGTPGSRAAPAPAEAAKLDTLLKREAELQRRWEALLSRCHTAAVPPPSSFSLGTPASGLAPESPRLGGPGGSSQRSVPRAQSHYADRHRGAVLPLGMQPSERSRGTPQSVGRGHRPTVSAGHLGGHPPPHGQPATFNFRSCWDVI
eukprot:TRINITY_DN2233_c0_g2_i1.p1 TRINITY_DN2233_c0_g2~~TRINITY_DN2233_c0_g2_i1.p1  ORF type:complete len:941 (+),score=258.61 TRINITY_DN2233_c0_g2_i1:68-2890(+)